MSIVFTREQLYESVWSEPMQQLSKQVGISDVAIAKHCRKAGIPVPTRGYWAKLQSGKPVTRERLAPRDLGTVNHIEMSGQLPPELRARIETVSNEVESIDVLAERLRKRLGAVTVPRNFARVHPAVATLLRKDEGRRAEAVKSKAAYGFAFDPPKFESPFERRRLLLLNGLFLGFGKVGGRPWVRGTDARELGIMLGDASVHFTLDRAGSGRQVRGRVAPATPTKEKLHLVVSVHGTLPGVTTHWQDDDANPLEKRLADIAIGMAVAGEHLHRRWIEQQETWERERVERLAREKEHRRLEAERHERERLAAMEKKKREGLVREAEGWRTAGLIRAYIEARLAASGDAVSVELRGWADWALAEADKLDPLVLPIELATKEPPPSEALADEDAYSLMGLDDTTAGCIS